MENVKFGLEIAAAILGIVFVLFGAYWYILGKVMRKKGL
jgi:hypothetical protein